MRKKFYATFIFCIIFIFNINSQKAENMKTIYIIGDSTACNYGEDRYPRTGWGQVLQKFFDETKVKISNRAISGRSSKSFYEEKAWDSVLKEIKEGDYVFIQFGHNDEKKEDITRFTEPFTTFKDYLKIYINQTRTKGAIPVLLTPIHRNKWSGGQIVDTHKDYLIAIRELAKEENVSLIDIADKTKKLFESLGEKNMNQVFLILPKGKYKNYPEGVNDNTHLQEKGAIKVANLVIEGIKEINLEIASTIKKTNKNF